MRVFIVFDGSCEPFDVSPDQTVGAVKLMVKNYFHVQLSHDNQLRHSMELSCAGALLQDSWVLTDIGITPSSVIRCWLKEEQTPVVRVFSGVTGETLSVMGSVFLLSASVARLKTLVSQLCGLPVGSFRLSSPAGRQLFDLNQLHDYSIDVGATLRLDTWDGWAEFLRGCFHGHQLIVQQHLSKERPEMRFQLRVALYIAASLGHLVLASWLLERGVRADEPVGVHPCREWCQRVAHPDATKSPAVVAAENGQLLILKLFINASVLTLACRDPRGRNPLKIALRHGHRECVRHLATKLCSVVALPGLALPMRTYIQVKLWARRGQGRVASRYCLGLRAPFRTRVGDTVLVDGFSPPTMSSKPQRDEAKTCPRVTSKACHPLTSVNGPPGVSCLSPALASQDASLRWPKLQPVATVDGREWRRRKKKEYGGRGWKVGETEGQSSNQWMSRVPLPPISRDTNPRPLFITSSPNSSQILTTSMEFFSRHCGRTPRENAIYCLSLASAFTERSWLRQLDVARTLARRSVQNMGLTPGSS